MIESLFPFLFGAFAGAVAALPFARWILKPRVRPSPGTLAKPVDDTDDGCGAVAPGVVAVLDRPFVKSGADVVRFSKIADALPAAIGMTLQRVFLVGHDGGSFQIFLSLRDEHGKSWSYELYGTGGISGAGGMDVKSVATLHDIMMRCCGYYLQIGGVSVSRRPTRAPLMRIMETPDGQQYEFVDPEEVERQLRSLAGDMA